MEAPPNKRFAVLTPPERAETARRLLQAGGLLATDLRPADRPDGVAFPVTDPGPARHLARRLGGRIVELPQPEPRPPRDPRERLRRALQDRLPGEALDHLPRGWRRLGDVVLVDLDPGLEPHRRPVARALGEVLGARAVVAEGQGVAGRRRRPRGRTLLWGDDAGTVHREDGLAYHLDPTEVMFSPGNESERARMGEVDAGGEVVADLFAGIGYFTIPLAARAGAEAVVGFDVNPTALAYLSRNADANDVAHRVHPVRADSRTLAGAPWADRVVLGYLPDPSDAFPAALSVLRPGGTLHHHRTVPRDAAPEPAVREVREAAGDRDREASVSATRTVKSVGPGSVHVVVDARIR